MGLLQIGSDKMEIRKLQVKPGRNGVLDASPYTKTYTVQLGSRLDKPSSSSKCALTIAKVVLYSFVCASFFNVVTF